MDQKVQNCQNKCFFKCSKLITSGILLQSWELTLQLNVCSSSGSWATSCKTVCKQQVILCKEIWKCALHPPHSVYQLSWHSSALETPGIPGPESRLTSKEPFVLLQRIQDWFAVPTWRLRTACHSNFRASFSLFWPPQTPGKRMVNRCTYRTVLDGLTST